MAEHTIISPKCSVIKTEVGPEETFFDLKARPSEEHGPLSKVTLHCPGEAGGVTKYQGPQRVTTVLPKFVLIHMGDISDKKPVEEEAPVGTEGHNAPVGTEGHNGPVGTEGHNAPVGTEGHNLSIHENSAENEAEQDNVILYPESPGGRAVPKTSARIHGNKASGKSKQNNHIGGSSKAAFRRL
ncbi:hypothetical protein JMJ35_004463 [Cladonia borealis]|uniref:Uncharacterized protein n=1 Tax=Cladonia borealis TaxID=184061 RepID=A0AA39V2M2_9LECA|nr:hypothetical protein JMJ35_004463 [Cladonia borealis]